MNICLSTSRLAKGKSPENVALIGYFAMVFYVDATVFYLLDNLFAEILAFLNAGEVDLRMSLC